MTTEFIEFAPTPGTPFQFRGYVSDHNFPSPQAMLFQLAWNTFGQRWYVYCYDTQGNLVFSVPLVGSCLGQQISDLTWQSDKVTVEMLNPHGYKIGTVKRLTIFGSVPDGYNGIFDCAIISPTAFTYKLMTNPGLVTTYGVMQYNISMGKNYFDSPFVYRTDNNLFEVSR